MGDYYELHLTRRLQDGRDVEEFIGQEATLDGIEEVARRQSRAWGEDFIGYRITRHQWDATDFLQSSSR